jgi:RNA polymerase sigma factor (TIGR02999 family)
MSGPPDTLAVLLDKADRGDADANGGLFAGLYDELQRLAQSHIRRRGGNVTLGVTTLLHEAYLDISGREALAFLDRARFLGYASRVMRGLVIDYVRGHNAQKRGGDLTFTTLDEGQAPMAGASDELEALSAALDDLATREPELAELVDLKFFCGFSFVEIAGIRNMSERTVQRDWAKARLLLHKALREEGERS